MIDLQDAVERARLMAGDDGLLSQYSYNMLIDELDDTERHAFTMALVDLGILARVANVEAKSFLHNTEDHLIDDIYTYEDILDDFTKVSQYAQDTESGLWVPESSWGDDEEWDLTDSDLEYIYDVGDYEKYNIEEVDKVRDTLEFAGLSVSPDGMVSFYQSAIPGIYKDKLPQKMPLETAMAYYDQSLDATDKEQTRIDELLDLLSRLTSQTYDLEYSLDQLENYKFSPGSKSEIIQNIYNGLEGVKTSIGEGRWDSAQTNLDDIKRVVDDYSAEQYEKYDNQLVVVDALDKLMSLRDENPEAFEMAISGLGGVSARKAQEMEGGWEDVIFIPVESSNVQEFGYDEENRMLYVRFLNGSLYVYYDVAPDIYDGFFMAPSKGKYVWSHLRDRYEYARVE